MKKRHRTIDDKVTFLRDGRNYPAPKRQVETIETHFAWVFLCGRYAYKLKKPVRHAAVDYRTLTAREHGCREELRLNRRLAAPVYLSVVPLTSRDGALRFGRHGPIEDWLVKMRRLDLSHMLDRTLARRALSAAEVDRLIGMLTRFFKGARPAPMAAKNYVGRLRREVFTNRRVLRRVGASIRQSLVDEVTRAQCDFIDRARELLGARGACVVEGHGDLRAEHVHLGRPLCVIDCLEFSRDLRLLDPAEELAYLALEIERLGRPVLAVDLVRRYRIASHDSVSDAIVSFYQSYRASTRAKLAAWHLDDPMIPDARPWLKRARSYLRDADRHVRRALESLPGDARPVVGGRPGIQQRRERRSGEQARHGLPEQRRDRQHAQFLVR